MLFAGSLHVDVDRLREQKWSVLALATIGVLLATVLYGFGIWLILAGAVPLPWCITLGALLAPTDPIAVGGLLREAGLPPGLLALVNGESLFNDGVARRRLRRHVGVGQRPRHAPPATIGTRVPHGGRRRDRARTGHRLPRIPGIAPDRRTARWN